MSTTRATLLLRVRDGDDEHAWTEFFELYAPLLEAYARAFGLQRSDAEEIRDQCLAVLAERMAEFRYERSRGSFQAWLRRLARDKIVDWLRRPREHRPQTGELLALPDQGEGPDRAWEKQWRAEHLRFALAEIRRAEDERGRERIELLLDERLETAHIAERLGWNANQVYKARSALLQRLRAVLKRLGEEA